MSEKTNYYLVAIVAIVAIIAIVVMFKGTGTKEITTKSSEGTVFSADAGENIVGEASRPPGPSAKVYTCDEVLTMSESEDPYIAQVGVRLLMDNPQCYPKAGSGGGNKKI